MANWVPITEDSIRTGKASDTLDSVKALADSRSEEDPVPEIIADVVSQLRAAVRAGNTLDIDPTKIPAALRGLAKRMIVRALYSYLEAPLDEDDRTKAREDASFLNRIVDAKLKFDAAENPDSEAKPWNVGSWNSERKLVPRTHPVPKPSLQQPAQGYANEESE